MVEIRELNEKEKEIVRKKTKRTGKKAPVNMSGVSYTELIPRTTLCSLYLNLLVGPSAYGIAIRSKMDNHSDTTAQNLSFSRAIDTLLK